MTYKYKFNYDIGIINEDGSDNKDYRKLQEEINDRLKDCDSSFKCYSELIGYLINDASSELFNPDYGYLNFDKSLENKYIFLDFKDTTGKDIILKKQKDEIKQFFKNLEDKDDNNPVIKAIKDLHGNEKIYKDSDHNLVPVLDEIKSRYENETLEKLKEFIGDLITILDNILNCSDLNNLNKNSRRLIDAIRANLNKLKTIKKSKILGTIIEDLIEKIHDIMRRLKINCLDEEDKEITLEIKHHAFLDFVQYRDFYRSPGSTLKHDDTLVAKNVYITLNNTMEIPLLAKCVQDLPQMEGLCKRGKCGNEECKHQACLRFFNCEGLYADSSDESEEDKIHMYAGKSSRKDWSIRDMNRKISYRGGMYQGFKKDLIDNSEWYYNTTNYGKFMRERKFPSIFDLGTIDNYNFKLFLIINICYFILALHYDKKPDEFKNIDLKSPYLFYNYNMEPLPEKSPCEKRINRVRATQNPKGSWFYSCIYVLSKDRIDTNIITEKIPRDSWSGIGRADETDNELYYWRFRNLGLDNLKTRLNDDKLKKEDLEKALAKVLRLDPNRMLREDEFKDVDALTKVTKNGVDEYFIRCNTPYSLMPETTLDSDGYGLVGDIEIYYYRKVRNFSNGKIDDTKVIKKEIEAASKNRPHGDDCEYKNDTEIGLNLPICLNSIDKKVLRERPQKKAKGFTIKYNKNARLINAGIVMKTIVEDYVESSGIRDSAVSANEFSRNILTNKETIEDWQKIKKTGQLIFPADQEWCHLQGHRDNGPEIPDNFVSGSKHCNTEQLAIELGHRPTTHNNNNEFILKSTAYLLKYNADQKRSRPIPDPSEPYEEHAKRQKTNNLRVIPMLNTGFTSEGNGAPIAAFIRYKISEKVSDKANGKKRFDYAFEGQSEFFDKNQFYIIQKTVEYIFNPDEFIRGLKESMKDLTR